MLVTVEEAMCGEIPGVGRCQVWEDAMCGNIPRILCQMCYHDNGQTIALLLNVEPSGLAAANIYCLSSAHKLITQRIGFLNKIQVH
jgi:hypothetical protein